MEQLIIYKAELFVVGIIIAFIALAVSFFLYSSLPSVSQPLDYPERPTAEEGKPIPVVFGTRIVKNPSVAWYGDIGYTPTSQLPEQSQE